MKTATIATRDEAKIRQIIADTANAICAKDLDRIVTHYANDVTFFDVKPPFQSKGVDAVRRIWEACLPYLPNSFEIETQDINVIVSGDLAIAHWLGCFTGMLAEHPAMQTWMRFTAVLQRNQDKWQILHEHGSVPFNPETSQAVFTL
ncbi:SgcJ/EcaC family oxidoreductase [Microcoleus sp. LEGE 07076]|uniref:YybH family protein n=1 Tax=Microcoleus sp. LEGE 07076 TaxID=915322 RepID=UPI00187F6FEF|nr:SgcJ/EcaC family oxidoreductase [Microcoleus sp. LEGE 07076]MBE9185510.1 SgcJ/EcaC family oxidoreductase [Microcoleus sp. LEGE 07076]